MTLNNLRKCLRAMVFIIVFALTFALAGIWTGQTPVYGARDAAAQPPKGEADAPRLVDNAELLEPEAEARLEEMIAQCKDKTGMDVVVATAYNDSLRSAMEFADDFYDYGGYGTGKKASGVLLLLYMDGPGVPGGESWISTSGNMIRILTDQRIEEIQTHMAGFLQGQYYEYAVEAFLEDIEHYVDKGIQKGQYNYDMETGEISVHKSIQWYEAAFALAVPAFIAASVCMGVKKNYSMEQTGRERANSLLAYQAGSKFRFAEANDVLVNKFVTSVPIPRPVKSSSLGGGASGRSTTHRSSSGSSHGGGGRRF